LARVDLIELYQLADVPLVDAEQVYVVGKEQESHSQHPYEHHYLTSGVLTFFSSADDSSVEEEGAFGHILVACWSEGERHILDECQSKGNEEPHSYSQANHKDEGSSPFHELLVGVLKHMLDVEGDADREPVGQLSGQKYTV